MKKLLVAIDAKKVNMKMLDFACYVAKLLHSDLTGIFIDNAQLLETMIHEPVHREAKFSATVKELAKLIDDNIHQFREACSNRGTNCAVYFKSQMPLADIIAETRYAELIIVDPEMSLKQKKEEIPAGFIRDILTKSECPVVLAPFEFHAIDEVLLAYDGSESSVYAIKQFTYLFPELTGKRLTVLQVNEAGNDLFSEKGKISDLLRLHYPHFEFQLLQGKAADEVFGYLLEKKNVFVVMGAYERNTFSRMFRPSTADLIIKTINAPVFIAHHK